MLNSLKNINGQNQPLQIIVKWPPWVSLLSGNQRSMGMNSHVKAEDEENHTQLPIRGDSFWAAWHLLWYSNTTKLLSLEVFWCLSKTDDLHIYCPVQSRQSLGSWQDYSIKLVSIHPQATSKQNPMQKWYLWKTMVDSRDNVAVGWMILCVKVILGDFRNR